MIKKTIFILVILPIISVLLLFSFYYSWAQEASTSEIIATIGITVCGNGLIQGSEQCDGSNLGGQTCVGLGYSGGTLSCNPDCTFNVSNCVSARSGVIWSQPRPETKVTLKGKACPGAIITVLIDGKVVDIITADSQANFKAELVGLTAGINNFGIWVEDKKGRKSITLSFAATILLGKTTTISGIFIPPTVELEKASLKRGEVLNILGQTVPQSKLNIYIELDEETVVRETWADNEGNWDYFFNTSGLEEGFYFLKVESISPQGLISSFSDILKLGIGREVVEIPCSGADFNKDEKVDLVDFSILLYWWEKDNSYIDQNQDGIINLQDFSIMMYYWTG